MTNRPAALNFENVSFQFAQSTRGLAALSKVTFQLNPGEIIAIVGESGCGKSTLLNIAAGFLKPTGGKVSFQGEPVNSPSPKRAVIFQDSGLMPWLTAKGNIELSLRNIRDKKKRAAEAEDALQKVGLSGFANLRPHQLSGGMRQRVSIARALAMDSDLLLMDEPFAALDAITRDTLIIEMQTLLSQVGKSALLVTHSAAEAALLADRIVCMGGRPGEVVDVITVSIARPRVANSTQINALVSRIQSSLRNSHTGFETQEKDNGSKIPNTNIGTTRDVVAGCCVGDFLGDRSAA